MTTDADLRARAHALLDAVCGPSLGGQYRESSVAFVVAALKRADADGEARGRREGPRDAFWKAHDEGLAVGYRRGVEEAARLCDKRAEQFRVDGFGEHADEHVRTADRIRALLASEPPPPSETSAQQPTSAQLRAARFGEVASAPRRGWKRVPERMLLSWDGRAFDVLDLNTTERRLVPIPDPPPRPKRRRKKGS